MAHGHRKPPNVAETRILHPMDVKKARLDVFSCPI
jgi:hypothetical protein